MFKKNVDKTDKREYINKMVRLIAMFSNYKEEEILNSAREVSRNTSEDITYILKVWESKANSGSFSLENEMKYK